MSGIAAVGAADLGTHAAVLDGEVAVSQTHHTATVLKVASLNAARCVEVANGGTVGTIERCGVLSDGSRVERQRIAFAVEGAFEPMFIVARHRRRHGDVVCKFDGLAFETVYRFVEQDASAEIVPALGSLDGVDVAALVLRDVVFIEREVKCCAECENIPGHSECIGAVVVVGDAVAKS